MKRSLSTLRSGFRVVRLIISVAKLRCGSSHKKSKPTPARACFPKILDEKIVNAILEQFLHSPMIHGQIGTGGNGFAYLMNILYLRRRGSVYFPASSFLDLDFGNRFIKTVECVDSSGKKRSGHKKSTLKPTQRIFFVELGSGYRSRILSECV